ncbi:MAG TPA: hypothetical protein VE439_02405 [Anaerolineae bacterium]|nr:hypothetical protein [Anaerolineae bacterium]
MKGISRLILALPILGLLCAALIGGYVLQHPKKSVSSTPSVGLQNLNPAEVTANSKLPGNIRKATGGPFKSKEDIIAKATNKDALGPNNKLSGRVEAVFMTHGEFEKRAGVMTGSPGQRFDVDNSKEVWVVVVGGEFDSTWRSNPSGIEIPPTKWIMSVYDATTGETLSVQTGPGDWPDTFFEPSK